MGLRTLLSRLAVDGAHLLVAGAPGAWEVRVAVERAARTAGMPLAASAADADALVVCGSPGPELRHAIDAVWAQLPGPRGRIHVEAPEDADRALEEVRGALLDASAQRSDAASRPDPLADDGESHDHDEHGDHEHMDHGERGDHEHMDHGGHEMEMAPAGIPLAEGAPDRDGLEMDVLPVRLGPILPAWPGGLVVTCTLHGDVVAEASAEVLDTRRADDHHPSAPPRDHDVARRLDVVADLLALAGWGAGAARTRRARDTVLDDREQATASDVVEDLERRVARARILRWSLRGVRAVSSADAAILRLPEDLAGDTYDRLLALVRRATDASAPEPSRVPLAAIPHLVTGLDLATARLVIASLGVTDASDLDTCDTHPEDAARA